MSELDQAIPTGKDPVSYPLLPLRDIVIFPHMVAPLFVGRAGSIRALELAMESDKLLFLATQKDPKVEEPEADDLYPVGTVGQIIQLLKLPDGTVKVLIEGRRRGRLTNYLPQDDHVEVEVALVADVAESTVEVAAMVRSAKEAFENYANLSKKVPAEMVAAVASLEDPSRLADTVIAQLQVSIPDKQDVLQLHQVNLRLEKVLALITRETEYLQIEKRIRSRVKSQMERSQKEYYLNEQMRAIQKELGERDDFKQELVELEEKIAKARMPKEAAEKARGELRKLKMMSPMSAEAAVVRNYIDWLVEIPWKKLTRDKHDLAQAEAVLEADHYGLQKVKERVLEYLAVQSLVKRNRGPILCLVGPPGVGKTSLGRSVAKALGRKFLRVALGGVRDEAEIRGHRRTYVGAMPGKIMQSLRKVGVRNPVFLLDEVDKMSTDFRGDPSAALLEVLDPEQNTAFADHFLDVDYDLSQVLFITTANSLHHIPRPLLDRMEVIRIEGYTETEKLQIARRYLVGKQLEAHGLTPEQLVIADAALMEIIRAYTRESGVRNLERQIAALCRKVAREVVKSHGKHKTYRIGQKQVEKYLGVPRYRYGEREANSLIGLATGLAWTEVGGEVLTVEVTVLPGSGKLMVTGKLGEVMRESAQAAMSYVRSRWQSLGLDEGFYAKVDVHIHVPEGAIPKDGPSAGITMSVALASALTGRAVDRNLAMTGEITLRGRVLAIGGLKEKLLAAKRVGVERVIIPQDNAKDLVEVPTDILSGLNVTPVEHMDEVLAAALLPRVESAEVPPEKPAREERSAGLRH